MRLSMVSSGGSGVSQGGVFVHTLTLLPPLPFGYLLVFSVMIP